VAERQDVLTEKQRDALAAELAELEGPRRKAAVEAIATARAHGDLSENFEYHSAKNEQGLLEARIRRLRSRLENATIVADDAQQEGEVGVGSIVEFEDEGGNKMEVEISSVGGAGAVSPDSPLGAALMGAKEGATVQVAAPRGSWQARVVAIRRS
jgi:transcription elongation factor GreA